MDVVAAGTVPSLIVLDMMMPGGDGWEFLKRRGGHPALARAPVLLVTALGIAGPEWASSLGASGCLRKPIDVETLVAVVRRYC